MHSEPSFGQIVGIIWKAIWAVALIALFFGSIVFVYLLLTGN